MRERLVTGDPTALPNAFSTLDADSAPGGRRGVAGMPGLQEVYLAVDSAIRPDERLLRLALTAKFVFGFESRPSAVALILEGGESVLIPLDPTSGLLTEPEPESAVWQTEIEEEDFDLPRGLAKMRCALTDRDRAILAGSAQLLGFTQSALLEAAANRFERRTLPRRMGWI